MFKSYGIICLRDNALVVEIDQEIGRYYFSQLKQNTYQKINKPRYNYHITIIGNTEASNILNVSKEVEFYYSYNIEFHNKYYYLNVMDNLIFTDIRKTYGLNSVYDPIKGFHITIANIK